MSVIERLGDALAMFWQSLDEREQRAVIFSLVYAVSLAASVSQARRRERDKRELAQMVAEELRHG